jgi:hypothetical protein
MSVLNVIMYSWIAINAALLGLLVIRRATHLKHRLYWRSSAFDLGCQSAMRRIFAGLEAPQPAKLRRPLPAPKLPSGPRFLRGVEFAPGRARAVDRPVTGTKPSVDARFR